VLNDLYEKYGYHLEEQMSITLKGEEGSAKIKAILEHFREADIESFAGIKINAKEDYQLSVRIDGKNKSDLAFPKSDVIKYFLSDGTWVAIRPSGTEPKMKFYFCVLGKNEEDAKNKYSALTQDIKNHIA
jgi:phosphoglucomutase